MKLGNRSQPRSVSPTRRASTSTPYAACELALDRGRAGTLEGPSAYFMKSPDNDTPRLTEEFIAAHADDWHGHAETQDRGAAASSD